MNDHRPNLVSYKSMKTVSAESVYQFLHGCMYGAAWGCVTPFYHPESSKALLVYRPGTFAPPFANVLHTVPFSALYVGTLFGVQRFACKYLELQRHHEDIYNELFGFTVSTWYYVYILNHYRRAVVHNRIILGTIVGTIIYANTEHIIQPTLNNIFKNDNNNDNNESE